MARKGWWRGPDCGKSMRGGHDEKLPITVSIGQASVRQDDSAESLLNRADQALYASKAGGRNRFSIADEE